MKMDGNSAEDRTRWLGMGPEERLRAILEDRVMRFDPFAVDDEALVQCAVRGYWRSCSALTQMLVFHFHEIRKEQGIVPYDVMYFHIGDQEEEIGITVKDLTWDSAHHFTKKRVHSKVNGRNIIPSNIETLQHKTVFVSHAIISTRGIDKTLCAYRMHVLKGDIRHQAATIRKAMLAARIEMLSEVLAHPASPHYLGTTPTFDYRRPLNEAIARLNHLQPHFN